MKGNRVLFAGATALLLVLGISTISFGASMGTSFVYQGRLDDGGLPANGSYEFQFDLYDSRISGARIGSTLWTFITTVRVIDLEFLLYA